MSSGSAWSSRRGRAFVLAEEPQQRRHVELTVQGTRRRAEWEDRRARLLAEVAGDISATMEQLKADVSTAIAEALQATLSDLSVRHEKPNLAPTTMTTSVVSEMSTSIQIPVEAYSISPAGGGASVSHDSDLLSVVPNTCSTERPGRDDSSSGATAAASASATRVVPPACVVLEGYEDLILEAPSKQNSVNAQLDSSSTSVPAVANSVMAVLASNTGITMVHENDQHFEEPDCTFGMLPSTAPPTATTTTTPLTSGAATATSPSVTRVVSSPCVLHDRGDHLAVSCFQPRGMPACVLPSIATPETSLVPLSMALEEYTVAPVNPSSNIVADPQVLTSATTKQAASAALESDSITALSANICEVCLEDVPDVPAAVLMQATLIIADSGGSDALVSLPALVDKPDGTDTAVTHENEQQLTSLSLERSLIFIAAKDVTNEDNLATSTFVMPAIASRATNPNKLIHGDRNLGMYLHPKFRFPMWVHAPWDPGEHAKEMQSPILRDSLLLASCWRFAPNQVQFIGGRLCLHINPGDMPFSGTVAFEWEATLTEIIFALEVQCVQLLPALFKWSDPCFYIHFQSPITLDFLLMRRAAHIASSPLFSQVSWIQQWRPPDHCWSDIHCAQSTIAIFDNLLQREHETTEFLGVQLRCESRNMGSITSMEEIVPAQLLEVYNMLCRLTSNRFPADLFVTKHWLVQWEPGDDSIGHHLMKMFAPLAISCELHYSVSVAGALIAAYSWVWCMPCVHLDTDSPHKSVLFLQPKPPWSYHAQTISAGVAESLHLIGNSFELKQFGVSAWPLIAASFWPTKAYFLRDDMKHNNRLLVDSSVVGSDALQCGLEFIQWRIAWSLSLGCFDVGNYYRQLIPDTTMTYHTPHDMHQNFPLECSYVIYHYMEMEIRSLADCSMQVLYLACDLSNYSAFVWCQGSPDRVDHGCSCPDIDTSQLPWDPGGLTRGRLEGKPKIKGGGLSATILLAAWAGRWAGAVGPWPAHKLTEALLQILGMWLRRGLAWTRTEKAASAEDACSVWRVGLVHLLLLDPTLFLCNPWLVARTSCDIERDY